VLAIGPVLLALPDRRVRALAIATAVGAAVLAPLLLIGSGSGLVAGARQTGQIFQPWQLFWPLGAPDAVVIGGDGLAKAGYRSPPQWLSPLTHPLIVFLAVPLSLLWARRHPRALRAPEQVLLLLAMLLLLRCVLDPWNNEYYALPFVLALLAWEALCRPERPPLVSLLVIAAHWITFNHVDTWASADVQWALYLAWTLPLAAWMASTALGSGLALGSAQGSWRRTVHLGIDLPQVDRPQRP
nr:hypothetical protein [Solirubrobacterales bacterium]